MQFSDIKTVMVIGSGFMGSGIAQVTAAAGYDVLLFDINDALTQKGFAQIANGLTARVEKGKMAQEEKQKLLSRIKTTTDLNDAKGADFIIEAIPENKELKRETFRKCDGICPPHTIFASNTSSISISSIAVATTRPDRFIGTHFFSPVPAMKLVEIIKGIKTSKETAEITKEFVEKIGKVGVFVKDSPGFLVNRVNQALRNEVFNCLEEGVATIQDIDTALKLGLGHPMGPFELNDFSGLDIGLAVIETLYDNFKDPKWKPNLTLKKMVEAGECGRKSGKGWYDYTDGVKKPRTDLNL